MNGFIMSEEDTKKIKKEFDSEKKKKIKKSLIAVLVLFLIAAIIFGCYKLYKNYAEKKEMDSFISEVEELLNAVQIYEEDGTKEIFYDDQDNKIDGIETDLNYHIEFGDN